LNLKKIKENIKSASQLAFIICWGLLQVGWVVYPALGDIYNFLNICALVVIIVLIVYKKL